jgi:hypothetical protein
MKRAKEHREAGRDRPDGRQPTSMYLEPNILVALKKTAIDEGRHAYEIVESALVAYLKKNKRI